MRQIRFAIFSLFGVVTILVITLLTPSTWLSRLVSTLTCTIFGFSSIFCVVSPHLTDRSLAQVNIQSRQSLSGTWTRSNYNFVWNNQGCRSAPSNHQQDEITLIQEGNMLSVPGRFSQAPTGQYTTGIRGQVNSNQFRLIDSGVLNGVQFSLDFRGSFSDDRNTITGQIECRVSSGTGIARLPFTWTRKKPLNTAKTLTFALSDIRQISSDIVEVYIDSMGGEGCRFVTTVRKQGDRIYQESARFIPSSVEACGLSPFSIRYQPDGNGVEIQSQPSRGSVESLKIQNLGNGTAKATYQGAFGNNSTILSNPPQPNPPQPNPPQPNPYQLTRPTSASSSTTSKLCELGRGICNLIDGLSKATTFWSAGVLGLQAGGTALPLLGNAVRGAAFVASSEAMLAALSVGFIANMACWLVFDKDGSLPPLPFADKIFKFGRDLPKAPGGKNLAEFTYDFASATTQDSFKNKVAHLRSKTRRSLGLDICDQFQTSVPTRTCNIPEEFWRSHRRVIGPVNLYEDRCLIKGSVMTRSGQADGQTSCGICFTPGLNFGPLPHKVSCNYREDPARRNPISTCPSG